MKIHKPTDSHNLREKVTSSKVFDKRDIISMYITDLVSPCAQHMPHKGILALLKNSTQITFLNSWPFSWRFFLTGLG